MKGKKLSPEKEKKLNDIIEGKVPFSSETTDEYIELMVEKGFDRREVKETLEIGALLNFEEAIKKGRK